MENKIVIAVITHKHGTNVYASKTIENVKKQVVEYCKEWWDDEVGDQEEDFPIPEKADDIINEYFKEENAGWKEGLEYFENIEIK